MRKKKILKIMNKIILMALVLFINISCDKEDVQVDNGGSVETTEMTTKLSSGTFNGENGYAVSGTAALTKSSVNKYFIEFADSFKSSFAAGSVALYTSSTAKLDLGKSSTFSKFGVTNKNGKQTYELGADFNLNQKYVIVWCFSAGVQFGSAELK
jgi:hypothetical protein